MRELIFFCKIQQSAIHDVSKLYFESVLSGSICQRGWLQLFHFVEKSCISTDCFQAACKIAYHELSFAHKISSQTIRIQMIPGVIRSFCLHVENYNLF